MKKMVILPLLMAVLSGFSQTKNQSVQLVNPNSVFVPKGFSQLAIIDLGSSRMLILSGQVPLDKEGNLVGKNDAGKQAEQVFTNVRNILEEYGGNMDNVVKLGIYLTDMGQLQAFRTARDKFINLQKPPASTLVQVNRLFRDDVLIEMEATAVIPKK